MRKIIFVLLYGILWGVLPLRAQKLVPASNIPFGFAMPALFIGNSIAFTASAGFAKSFYQSAAHTRNGWF